MSFKIETITPPLNVVNDEKNFSLRNSTKFLYLQYN